MATGRTIEVFLTANDAQLRSVLVRSAAEVKGFGREVDGAGAATERSSAVMSKAFAGVGIAAAAGLAMAVHGAMEFETSMRNVNSISHMSEEQFAATSARVLDLSTQLPQSANTLAKGLYDIASSGFQGADGLKILEESAKAASAGLTTTDNAAQAITAVLNAYGRSAGDAADISDVLFQTVNLGVINFEQLTGVIGEVVGTAAAAKVGIDQVGAAIATMTLSGISAEESGTSLNRVFQSLLKPSDSLALVLHNIGYESGAQALQTDGLRGVMDKLRGAVGSNAETWITLFTDIRAGRGALALIANEGQNYARVSGEITDANKRHGATQAALNEQMKALGYQFKIFMNQVNAVAIEGATHLLPVLKDILDGAGELADSAVPGLTAGFRALQPFFEGVASTGEHLADIAGQLFDAFEPIGALLLGIAAGTVITGLNALATALEAVTGFLSDNIGIVEAVAVAYGVHLAAGAIAATTALGLSAFELAAATLITLGREALTTGTAFLTSATNVEVLKGALFGLAAVGAVVGILGIVDALQSADAAAEKLNSNLTRGADQSTIAGTDALLAKIDEANKSLKSTGDGLDVWEGLADLLPGIDTGFFKTNASLEKLQETAGKTAGIKLNLTENINTIRNFTGQSQQAVEALAAKLKVDLTQGFDASTQGRADIINDFLKMSSTALGGGEAIKQASLMSIDQLQALAAASDQAAKATGDAFSKDTDLVSGFAKAVQGHSGAVDGVASANEKLASAQERLNGLQDSGTASGDALASAQDDVAKATQGVADAQGKLAGTDPAAFFQKTLEEANTFATQISEAAARGLDPKLIQQLLEAGPQSAAPLLSAIADDHSGHLIELANDTQAKLATISASAIEMSRVTQRAINTDSVTMAADFGRAMDIMRVKAELGAGATAQAVAEKLGIGVGDVQRIAGEYVIVLGNGVNQMPGVAGGAGDQASAALIAELGKRTDEAGAIARNYAAVLAGGLDPLLKGLGSASVAADIAIASQQPSGSPRAEGGFALTRDSGFQPPGTLIQWAEPETQGEYHAFIPRAGAKRENARRVLSVAARDLGGVATFAEGGFHNRDDVPGPPAEMSNYGTMVGATGNAVDQYEYDKVTAWIDAHPPAAPGGGGGAIGSGWKAITDYLDTQGVGYTVNSTTGGQHVAGSLHYQGKAVDLGGNLRQIFDTLLGITSSLQELFYDPAGFSVKNGARVDWTVGGHSDHVHAATFDQGGFLKPGLNVIYNGTGKPEAVIPSDTVGTGPQSGWSQTGAGVLAQNGAWMFHEGAIAEDDPGWDWRTMGNHLRGVITPDGAYMIEDSSGQLSAPAPAPTAAADWRHSDRYGANDPRPWQPGDPPVDSPAWNSMFDPHANQPGYVQAEDGSWVPASFYERRSYDRGGWLMPGHTMAYNGTGHPEAVGFDYKAMGREVAAHVGRELANALRNQPTPVIKVGERQLGEAVSRAQYNNRMARR